MMRIEQRGQMAAMQQLESKSDEELEAETRYKAAAQAILGYRAAERYDAKAARAHFQRALAAARGAQERAAHPEDGRRVARARRAPGRRPQARHRAPRREAPTTRQLRSLRFIGLIAPPASAGVLARIRGILIAVTLVIAILALAFGIVYGIGQIFGGVSVQLSIFWAFVLVAIVIAVLALFGRRRQKRAQAERAEQIAARSR